MSNDEADGEDKGASSPTPEADGSTPHVEGQDKGKAGEEKGNNWSNNFKEIQGLMTKQAQENAALRAEVELLKTSTTGRLDELNKKAEPQEPKVDAAALDAKWIETIENGGAKGILELVKNATLDGVDMVRREYEAKLTALHERLEQVDPDYLSVKEKADKLVKTYNMDRKNAVKMVKDQMKGDGEGETSSGKTAGVQQPPRNRPPGRTSGVATTDESDGEVQEVSPGEGVENYLRAMGGTDKDIKALRTNIGKGLKDIRHG